MPENIFSSTNLYTPPHPLHFHGFEGKQKNSYGQFFKMSHFKNNCSNPLVNRFFYNSAKMCLIDKNKKSRSLEVLVEPF